MTDSERRGGSLMNPRMVGYRDAPDMILKYELESLGSDKFPTDGDWWTLCYDTDRDVFYVDHEWDRTDPLHPARHLRSGVRRYGNAASWRGPGSKKLASGMARLMDRARGGAARAS